MLINKGLMTDLELQTNTKEVLESLGFSTEVRELQAYIKFMKESGRLA